MSDAEYIKHCFELAKNGEGHVSPNPLVGAVIVKEGRIIGEGWHEKYGGPHAEVNAFNNAKESVEGAVLYCNLEPCCHTDKQTPPCTPLIISKGIKRVVVSNLDPNPRVCGKGLEQLKAAGIETVSGISADEGEELNRFYFKYAKEKLPFVTVKIAQSLDGKITNKIGEQTYISGEDAQKFVHSQRAAHDAVLIGANTVLIDDPQLSVRHVPGRNPVRVIIDGPLSTPAFSGVCANCAECSTWIFTAQGGCGEKIKQLEDCGARIFELPAADNCRLDLKQVLEFLGKEKITSVLVEGGSEIFSQFIQNSLFDELVVLISPVVFGEGLNAVDLAERYQLKLKSTDHLGEDIKLVFTK